MKTMSVTFCKNRKNEVVKVICSFLNIETKLFKSIEYTNLKNTNKLAIEIFNIIKEESPNIICIQLNDKTPNNIIINISNKLDMLLYLEKKYIPIIFMSNTYLKNMFDIGKIVTNKSFFEFFKSKFNKNLTEEQLIPFALNIFGMNLLIPNLKFIKYSVIQIYLKKINKFFKDSQSELEVNVKEM